MATQNLTRRLIVAAFLAVAAGGSTGTTLADEMDRTRAYLLQQIEQEKASRAKLIATCHDPVHRAEMDRLSRLEDNASMQALVHNAPEYKADLRAVSYWAYRLDRAAMECQPDTIPDKAAMIARVDEEWANNPDNPNNR